MPRAVNTPVGATYANQEKGEGVPEPIAGKRSFCTGKPGGIILMAVP